MQAISIGIGKAGIHFFAQQFLADKILDLLKTFVPPDRTISVPAFSYSGGYDTWTITNLSIQLTGGFMYDYAPVYQDIEQGMVNGVALFTLHFPSKDSFVVGYSWQESYDWDDSGTADSNGHDFRFKHDGQKNETYSYDPVFSSLNVKVAVQFAFNTQNNAWEISVHAVTADATNQNPAIPGDSVLQKQSSESCSFSSHVSDATTQAIDSIDFATPISNLISGILKTIPGSGNLGDGIVYDFSLGDGGMAFPNNDGIQLGVKGGASYNGAVFSENAVPSLPFPLPPADSDTHHLNMFVSNFEIDALNWAFFKAGKLNLVVKPEDLPQTDSGALDTKTYVSSEFALLNYAEKNDVMYAYIQPYSAPTTSFQKVYIYSAAVMNLLQNQLPADVYASLGKLPSDPFLSQQNLEDFLTLVQVPNQYFDTIEKAGEASCTVVAHDLSFKVVIQDAEYNYPYIKFRLTRTDILSDLSLGLSGQAQTMQFGFINAGYKIEFIDSSVPNFDGSSNFAQLVWESAGEIYYANCLQAMGKTGVPLPIMQGLQFDFANAELSIQEGYVSILANVLYQNS